MRVHEVMARTLEHAGVEAVFAVMGDANMRWLADLSASGKVMTYYARSEAGAVAMADGWARATGRTGICTVTVGPGLTVATTSLLTAARHRTPLLLIAGDVPHRNRAHIQYIDQRRFVEAIGVSVRDLASAGSAADDLRRALALAETSGSPVVLNTATNLQDEEYPSELEAPNAPVVPARQRLGADPSLVDRVAVAMMQAERPVIVAGRGAVASGAREALVSLADRTGALLATTLLAKGYFRDDPHDVGMIGLFATELCQELVAEADCVLVVGASLNHYTTHGGGLFPQARLLRIDTLPYAPADGVMAAETYLQADALTAVLQIERATDGARRVGYRVPEVTSRIRAFDPVNPAHDRPYDLEGLLDPRAIMRIIDAKLSDRDITVIGMGHFWWFPIHFLRSRADDSFIHTHDFGAIGQGLATGVGAAIGRPDRTVNVIEGDASALMAIQELDTAARYGVAIRVFVMDDAGVGAEYHHLKSLGLEPRDSILRSPDLATVAEGFGATGIRVDRPDAVELLIDEHWEGAGPRLFDLRISREVLSEPNRKLWYPEVVAPG
jgi:thiamine pyrophosphate-dependent acetolactate synthase large subunit-like protein